MPVAEPVAIPVFEAVRQPVPVTVLVAQGRGHRYGLAVDDRHRRGERRVAVLQDIETVRADGDAREGQLPGGRGDTLVRFVEGRLLRRPSKLHITRKQGSPAARESP